MNPLLGILAAPTAASALEFAGRAVEGASAPFAELLESATRRRQHGDGLRPVESFGTRGDEEAGLLDLEGLFASLGF